MRPGAGCGSTTRMISQQPVVHPITRERAADPRRRQGPPLETRWPVPVRTVITVTRRETFRNRAAVPRSRALSSTGDRNAGGMPCPGYTTEGASYDPKRNLQAGRTTGSTLLHPRREFCLHSLVGVILTACLLDKRCFTVESSAVPLIALACTMLPPAYVRGRRSITADV